MAGDDRARFCETCDLTVHDLSAMSDAGARALLAGPAERLCVRFNVRRDGMVVTRSRTRWLGASLGALGIAIAAVAFWAGVMLLQRPWRALARKLAASTSPMAFQSPPSKDDEERNRTYDEFQKRLAAAALEMARPIDYGRYGGMGTISTADIGWIGLPPLADTRQVAPKHAKKPRR